MAKGLADRLVYALHVEEILTFDEYWTDARFGKKRPNLRGSLEQRYGDNIYRHENGEWMQVDSRHSFADGSPNPGHVVRDTKADVVLLGREFVYFGGHGPVIPDALRGQYGFDLCHGRPAYRVNFSDEMVAATVAWIDLLPRGVQGDPADW
jgi:hypothetical protein